LVCLFQAPVFDNGHIGLIASLGRFISEDPLKGSMISSQSQNPYVYCVNNPLRYIDPTGMEEWYTWSEETITIKLDIGGSGPGYSKLGDDLYGNTYYKFSSTTDAKRTGRKNLSVNNGVSVTVTSQSYAESGKRSGAPNYQPPMGDPKFTNPARNAKPADAIIIGFEGCGGTPGLLPGTCYAGEAGWAIVIGKHGVQRYVYGGGGGGISGSAIPGTSATGKFFIVSVDYGEGVTTLDGASTSISMTGVMPVSVVLGVGGDITYSISSNGTVVYTMGPAAGTSGGTIMLTEQYWVRYEPTGDTTPNTCTM